MKTIKYILLSAILIGFTSCNNDDEGNANVEPLPELTAGDANFATYVSVGNSLTAGFTDNALFIASQTNSFPNILSQKFGLLGGGAFTQPLMNDNVGGLTLGGMVIQGPRLFFDGSGPVPLPAMPTTEVSNILSGPFNNMGVPGAKSFHLLANGYGNIAGLPNLANPYFVRMASSPNASVMEDALIQQPTFMSLWIGSNDVLGYAVSGGDGSNPITDQATFAGAYAAIIGAMQQSGTQAVVANIPYVTTIPHFTTVPHNPLDPTNPAFGPQIPTLNGIFGQLNQVYAFLESQGVPNATDRQIVFSETSASAVVIKDESIPDLAAQIAGVLLASPTFPAFVQSFGLPAAAAPLVANLLGATYGQTRQATENDLLVLPSSSIIGTVNTDVAAFLELQGLPAALAAQFSVEGVSNPLADKWVLLPSEQAEIQAATDAFNTVIANSATQAGYGFVDANAVFQQMSTVGYSDGNFTLTSDLVTGGAVSLDGVHGTSRGYALVANLFLKAIDATYGSNFEASGNLVDIGDYPTNYPPTLQ